MRSGSPSIITGVSGTVRTTPSAEPLLNAVHRRADLVGEVHRVPDVAEATRLDALGVEDVAGHRLEATRVGEGAAYGAVPILVAHHLPVVEARLQEAEHPGHRCAQLVGDDRDELVLGAVELAQAGLLLPGLPQPPCEDDRQGEADGEQQQDEDESSRLQGPGQRFDELRAVLGEHDAPPDDGYVGADDELVADLVQPLGERAQPSSGTGAPSPVLRVEATTAPLLSRNRQVARGVPVAGESADLLVEGRVVGQRLLEDEGATHAGGCRAPDGDRKGIARQLGRHTGAGHGQDDCR